MLEAAKLMLGIVTDAYNTRIASLLKAGARDLMSVGVVIAGDVIDGSITDDYVKEAILTYVACHFGNPPNYQQLSESYDYQKKKLANTTGYTEWGGDE